MKVREITINDFPYEQASEGPAGVAEAEQRLKHFLDQHPDVDQSRPLAEILPPELFKELIGPLVGSVTPFPQNCVRVSMHMSGAEFWVNLETNTLERINVDLTGYEPDEFEVDADLADEDDYRARLIASSLGHATAKDFARIPDWLEAERRET